MANEQLETFLKAVKADPPLRHQLASCPNLEAIANLGASLGYQFTGIDLVRHQAEATLRLSEVELAAAAAGVALEGHLWLARIVWD